jgi:hypothetical protein
MTKEAPAEKQPWSSFKNSTTPSCKKSYKFLIEWQELFQEKQSFVAKFVDILFSQMGD